jgi:hypothetical protein
VHQILNELRKSKIIKEITILELIQEEETQAIRIKATIINNTILYINEVIHREENRYSYHWQTPKGKMLMRWDNAPHWKNISTFPHHKHIGNKLLPSPRPILKEILTEIEKIISSK